MNRMICSARKVLSYNAKFRGFSFISKKGMMVGEEQIGGVDVRKLVKTYYKSPEVGVPMAAKDQRMLGSFGGENCAVATWALPRVHR